MVKKFWRKANALLLVAAMTVTLLPAQMAAAAGSNDSAEASLLLQQANGMTGQFFTQQRANDNASVLDAAAVTGREYTVIKGNTPVLPKQAMVTSDNGSMAAADIQWAEWDESLAAGKHTVTGTANGNQLTVTINVLPCDEEVADAQAMGRQDGDTTEEKLQAIHPLKGYKGLFVAEYDIVPNDVKPTHDRAIIYLPSVDSNGSPFSAESCWDYGARLQFKFGYNNETYFQTQNGDGRVIGNAKYYPTNEELTEALDKGETVNALKFDETSTYRVRTVMDTASDTTKGNVKIYITDPQGVEHEVTKPGGNGFRLYPTDGIVKNFAAVRGSYRMENHKISWISGYATKNTEIYLKGQDATEYVKESEALVSKELPGVIAGNPDKEVVRNNQSYTLDSGKSGWYNGEEKVESVTAQEGETVTYRAYYNYAKAIDKTALNEKVQETESLLEADYTASSWDTFKDAREKAQQVNTSTTADQAEVDTAVQALTKAEEDLVSIKDLKIAIDKLKAELTEKEEHKADYVNWAAAESALASAERVLNRANATKSQVQAAEESLNIKLITVTEKETAEAKEAMENSVKAAEQKVQEIKESEYTPASVKALKDALEACKNLDPEKATKADYDSKKSALDQALAGLAKLADKTALNQVIADAKAKKEAEYEAASFKNMQQKLNNASAVAANVNATQAEVDKARNDLFAAVEGLVKLAVKSPEVKVTSVKPAAKTYKIAVGKKLDLKKVFTVSPQNASNKKLTYSIDTKIAGYASIKSGVVTVKKKAAGKTVVVRATAADGSGKTAIVKIKVMKNAVTKITVKKKSLTVKAGKKVTIKPVVKTNGKKANKTLSYTSSNSKLATVKNGVVTTKKGKTGKVTITIKSTDGTNKSAKVKINIKK